MDDIQINQWLKDSYGCPHGTENPRWRIIWTTGLTEKRRGNFREHTSGGIFLREVNNAVLEVPKYPFDKDRWVLEQLCEITDLNISRELCDKLLSYEPFWIFKAKDGSFLPLDRNMIEVLIFMYVNKDNLKRNATQINSEDEVKQMNEVERNRQHIGEMMSVPHLMNLIE